MTTQDHSPSVVERLTHTFSEWLKHRQELSEMRHLSASEFDRIANDLRLSPADLDELVRHGPHAADELPKLLQALGISQEDLARVEPLVLHDMISSPNGVETTLGCSAADRAVADSPAAAVKRKTVRNMACAQPSSEPADKVQCLGDMPWRCRATAVQPDGVHVGAKPRKVNCCINAA